MRVIAGRFRSRILKTADNLRPTTDRVRETLFNVLQNEIEGSIFVDAFAGSGSVGIEAISRGAATAYFIESNRKALQVLEQNLESLAPASWRILTMDVWKALEILPQQLPSVDLFFFDPPYTFTKYAQLLMAAATRYPAPASSSNIHRELPGRHLSCWNKPGASEPAKRKSPFLTGYCRKGNKNHILLRRRNSWNNHTSRWKVSPLHKNRQVQD